MRKKGQLAGFLKGQFFSAKITDLSALVMLQKAIEEESYKADGYDNVRDFCKDVSGMSYEACHAKLGTIKKIGAEATSILTSLNLTFKDVRMIEYALIEDPKTGTKVLKIDEQRQIPFNEDRLMEIQTAIDLIKEQRDSERKEAKRLQSTNNGLNSEIKEREKKIAELESLQPKEKNRHWCEHHLKDIEKLYRQTDLSLRAIAFDDRIWEDPQLQGMVLGLSDAAERLMLSFRQDFQKATYERYGE